MYGLMKILTAGSTLALILIGQPFAFAQTVIDDSFPEGAPIKFVEMHKGVSKDFIDPSSAQYKSVSFHDTDERGIIFCGWVNSRNSFGGYTKFYPFWYSVDKKDGVISDQYDNPVMADLANITFGWVGCKSKLGL